MFELLLFNLLPIGIGVAALLPFLLRSRRRLRGWKDAADVAGLQVLKTSGLGPQLTALAGQVTVMLDTIGDSTRIVLRGPVSPSLHSVSIRRESLLRRAPEIETGDPSFDSTFFIEGPLPQVLALLDAEMRGRMIRANQESRLQISNGLLQADLSDEMVLFLLPLLVDIGRRLAQPMGLQPMDIPRRLAENARRDPEPGVRLRNLLALAHGLPGAPETMKVLREACSDRSPEIRLRTAQELGDEGRDVLLNLVESLEDDAVSAEAVSILDRELTFERTRAILDQALEKGRARTARACLEALGRSGASPGQLSVAEAEAGQLSLAASETGQLSLAVEPFPLSPEELAQPAEGRREGPVGRPI